MMVATLLACYPASRRSNTPQTPNRQRVRTMKYAGRWFSVSLLCVLLVGCSRGTDTASSAGRSGSVLVLVLVAASTQDAVQENAAAFTQETGIEVKINADDS